MENQLTDHEKCSGCVYYVPDLNDSYGACRWWFDNYDSFPRRSNLRGWFFGMEKNEYIVTKNFVNKDPDPKS
jgi:hypothetical protein